MNTDGVYIDDSAMARKIASDLQEYGNLGMSVPLDEIYRLGERAPLSESGFSGFRRRASANGGRLSALGLGGFRLWRKAQRGRNGILKIL